MLNFPAWKVAIIAVVLLWGGLLALPNAFTDGFLGVEPRDTGATDPVAVAEYQQQLEEVEASWWPGLLPNDKVNLGLDLQGGVYLLMEIDPSEVASNRLEVMLRDIQSELNKQPRIVRTSIPSVVDGRITIGLQDASQMSDAVRRLRNINPNVGQTQTKLMTINQSSDTAIQITVSDGAKSALASDAQGKMMEIIRRRVDPDGVAEVSITPQGDTRIILEAPGEADPKRIKDILSRAGRLTFNMADLSPSAVRVAVESGVVRPGYELVESADNLGQILIRKIPELTGSDIVSANRGFDPDDNSPAVNFSLSGAAKTKFYNLTRTNRGNYFAIVLDGVSMSSPRINEPIPGGNVQISGNFTMEEADDLAAIIEAGELPAKLQFLEERTVGPGLGQESIEAGSRASMIGLIFVGIFMVLAYGLIGGFAVGSLMANIILILGALSGFGATLTLPGIAGIILTIGMAVDANVIVFERIREEQASGRSPSTAIQAGYEKAFSAILDANITTFIAASILYLLGSGPVKGFAVTLAIGILTSVFTAFVVTRWFTVMYLRTFRPKRLAM